MFLWSFVMLFVELALIRWTGERVLYLSFFSNFVLLGSFLGIGIGFLRAGRRHPISRYAPLALAVLIGFLMAFPVEVDRAGDELIYFGGFTRSGLSPWIILPILFLAVAAVLATIADGVAREFAKFAPLRAYRIDITGSIAGTLAFTGLAYVGTPPIVWGAVAAVLLLLLTSDATPVIRFAPLAALLVLLLLDSTSGAIWSPYYRIDVLEDPDRPEQVRINVNGIPHQTILPATVRLEQEPLYAAPYERNTGPGFERALVVGAGNGTDVAIALRNGVGSVDAVEIDPELVALGEQRNPDQPYEDSRVRVIVDDGRAFLRRADATYDLVLYALPDSLTLVSGQANLRLESYLFTEESLAEVHHVLEDDGVFAMYNLYREPWLVARLADMLETEFGVSPCVDLVGVERGLAMLIVSESPDRIDCSGAASIPASVTSPGTVTDDRPFLYLRGSLLPPVYALAVIAMFIVALAAVRLTGLRLGAMGPYMDLFFMGAAFLLLEVRTVAQFALLFGSTWLVNAMVFGGILVAVLAAIELAKMSRLPPPGVLYAALFVSLAVIWLVPTSALLGLAPLPRLLVGVAVAFTPVLLANIVFAQRFRDTASSTTAFGTNLLGAIIGGGLEYSALVVGYRVLALAVALLYALALISWRMIERRAPQPQLT